MWLLQSYSMVCTIELKKVDRNNRRLKCLFFNVHNCCILWLLRITPVPRKTCSQQQIFPSKGGKYEKIYWFPPLCNNVQTTVFNFLVFNISSHDFINTVITMVHIQPDGSPKTQPLWKLSDLFRFNIET